MGAFMGKDSGMLGRVGEKLAIEQDQPFADEAGGVSRVAGRVG
jgi:hypothetical protein